MYACHYVLVPSEVGMSKYYNYNYEREIVEK